MLINALKGVLLPFCVACLIAYIFEPFVQFNRRLLHLVFDKFHAVFVAHDFRQILEVDVFFDQVMYLSG